MRSCHRTGFSHIKFVKEVFPKGECGKEKSRKNKKVLNHKLYGEQLYGPQNVVLVFAQLWISAVENL